LGKDYPTHENNPNKVSLVPQFKINKMRESFLYWYPMDMRCSAKDLIKNHLTMALFNHVAIWDDQEMWPKGYYCNGYILVEGEKMSKSKGNFINLISAIEDYGADAARLACAQAGDSINDANFTADNANAAILQLSTFEMFMGKMLENKHQLRKSKD
jgi:leucyl-tRNA synthetase